MSELCIILFTGFYLQGHMKLLERKIQPFFQWDVLHKRLCTAQVMQIINVKNGPVERQA